MMTRLIPKIFYRRLEEGLDLFVRCLSFKYSIKTRRWR